MSELEGTSYRSAFLCGTGWVSPHTFLESDFLGIGLRACIFFFCIFWVLLMLPQSLGTTALQNIRASPSFYIRGDEGLERGCELLT